MKATVLNNGRLHVTLLDNEVRISAAPCPWCEAESEPDGDRWEPTQWGRTMAVAAQTPQHSTQRRGLFARIGDIPIGRFLWLLNVALWSLVAAVIFLGPRLFR